MSLISHKFQVATPVLLFSVYGDSITALLAKVNDISTGDDGAISKSIFLVPLFTYLFFMFFFTLLQQYIYVRLTNYCWHHSRLGKILFKSTIEVRRLVYIRLTNILAIIFSCGLLAPWAKIRRTRYILENLSLEAYCNLDEFTAATSKEEGALGDAATDFFDFEIGL